MIVNGMEPVGAFAPAVIVTFCDGSVLLAKADLGRTEAWLEESGSQGERRRGYGNSCRQAGDRDIHRAGKTVLGT